MSEYIMKYKHPAQNNGEAIPISNGRVGGMVYGDPVNDLIKINVDGFWSGKPCDRANPDSADSIKEIRRLIDDGNIREAEREAAEKLQAVPSNTRKFMPLLNLHIRSIFDEKARSYIHWLDTSTSISAIEFNVGMKHFIRTAFCTGDEGIIIGFECNEEKSISFDAWLDGKEEYCTGNSADKEYNNRIIYTGGIGGAVGINFASCLALRAEGGEVKVIGNRLSVRNADFVMLVFNARTDLETEEFDEHLELLMDDMNSAMCMTYDNLLQVQKEWYQEQFNLVELNLESNSIENLNNLSTDERILRLKGDVLDSRECTRLIHDNQLIELYFNFSRYIMITAGTFDNPLNILGIWNDNPDANVRYDLSGRTQMCYWIADALNIEKCSRQLFSLAKRICSSGKKAAKDMYGIKHGSVCHTATDIFGDCMPNGTEPESFWVMGLAWLAIHVYEHYEYTLNESFLSNNYEVMKRAAEFFVNYLVEDENGRLVVSPTVIPTSEYVNEKGVRGKFGKGSTLDSQILRVLFSDVIKASEILGCDKKFADVLNDLLPKLPEIEIGKYGQIKEWLDDYENVDSESNILYHLFGLHPADIITPPKTPKLAAASRTTLVRRLIHGGLDKGWGCAWTANMWARLYDGDMVYENIKNILTRSTASNLINMYPDFSIDANFGTISAITESLLQSTNGEIVILPALPKEWADGSVKGLRAKGGFEIDMTWADGRLTGAEIKSYCGQECRLRFVNNIAVSIICEDENISPRIENGVVIFNTTKNTTYTVRC